MNSAIKNAMPNALMSRFHVKATVTTAVSLMANSMIVVTRTVFQVHAMRQ